MAEYESEEELLKEARARFNLSVEAFHDQREREAEDLRFQHPENQWSDAAKKERRGGEVAGIMVPPRPMPAVSQLKQPLNIVINQFMRARLSVGLHPISEAADEELAEIKQGIYRRIERDGEADQARGWAFQRASKAGLGWYRINCKYDEDADPNGAAAWDQEIVFERILFQENVYPDPSASKPDFSDGRYLFHVEWLSKDEYRERYPNSELSKAQGSIEWEAFARAVPGWVNASAGDHDEKGVQVALYWRRHCKRETVESNDGRKRERETYEVYCYDINGLEVLDKVKWDGQYIPYVPIIGEEPIPVDGERRWQGMIRDARDAQQIYNFGAASLIESMAMEPKAPWMVAEGQDEGYENEYQLSNIRNIPVMHYKPVALGDKPVAPPFRVQVDGSRMNLALLALNESKGWVQSTTAVHAYALGEESRNGSDKQSGKAIIALQRQTEAGTSQYIDSWKQVSGPYEARIVLDLIPHKYDRPGRVTAIVTGEDEDDTVMLGVPFSRDPASGRPVPAKPGDPEAKVYDLRKGKYGITVEVGEPRQTKQQEGEQFMSEVIASAPQLMTIIGDLVFKFRDEPGAKEIAERMRKMIGSQNPSLLEDGGASADQAQAENQALKQQLQLVTQQLQQAVQAIQTKQVEQAAKIQVEQIKADADLKMQELRNVGAITVAQIQAEAKGAQEQTKARNEAAATGLEVVHEERMQDKEHAHEVAMASAGGNTMTRSVNRGQEGEREDSQEESGGSTREHSEEDQPPQQAGA